MVRLPLPPLYPGKPTCGYSFHVSFHSLVLLLHLTLTHSFLQVAKRPCDGTEKQQQKSCKSIHSFSFLSVLPKRILLLPKALKRKGSRLMEEKLGQFKDEETVVKEVVSPKVHVTIQ